LIHQNLSKRFLKALINIRLLRHDKMQVNNSKQKYSRLRLVTEKAGTGIENTPEN